MFGADTAAYKTEQGAAGSMKMEVAADAVRLGELPSLKRYKSFPIGTFHPEL